MKFEQDAVSILSGVRHGLTLGGPIAVEIKNSEWPKWETVMSPDPVPPESLLIDAGTGDEREIARNKPLTRPRPGHADMAGMLKYNLSDARPILERASARETAARVVVGQIAQNLLQQVAGIELVAHVTAIGSAAVEPGSAQPVPADTEQLDANPVRCHDPEATERMVAQIDEAKKAGETLGGVVEVIAYGAGPGLGSHVHWDRRLDSRLAAAMMGVQAIKGVEIGDGFAVAALPGSEAHDEMVAGQGGPRRLSNRAGGIEGGMSNGEPIVVRAAMKPISTVPRALRTIDVSTGQEARAIHQRSDVCAVAPAAVVAQAMAAVVVAEALMEKTGGDSLEECRRNYLAYLEQAGWSR